MGIHESKPLDDATIIGLILGHSDTEASLNRNKDPSKLAAQQHAGRPMSPDHTSSDQTSVVHDGGRRGSRRGSRCRLLDDPTSENEQRRPIKRGWLKELWLSIKRRISASRNRNKYLSGGRTPTAV